MLLWRKKTDKGRMTLGKVQKEYRENDVCMGELLDALPADGLSIEAVSYTHLTLPTIA